MKDKLSTYSRILIASQTINYMSSSLHSVNEQLKRVNSKYISVTVDKTDVVLEDVCSRLIDTMQYLGSYMNSIDCVHPLDLAVINPAFELLGEQEQECYNETRT